GEELALPLAHLAEGEEVRAWGHLQLRRGRDVARAARLVGGDAGLRAGMDLRAGLSGDARGLGAAVRPPALLGEPGQGLAVAALAVARGAVGHRLAADDAALHEAAAPGAEHRVSRRGFGHKASPGVAERCPLR